MNNYICGEYHDSIDLYNKNGLSHYCIMNKDHLPIILNNQQKQIQDLEKQIKKLYEKINDFKK